MWPRRRSLVARAVFLLVATAGPVVAQRRAPAGYVPVPAGAVRPLFGGAEDGAPTAVRAFFLSPSPVSNAEFLRFVTANPEWRRSRVPGIAADAQYLRQWAGDLVLGPTAPPTAPVLNVSWFAAAAYAEWIGARLPTAVEWERIITLGLAADPGSRPAQHEIWAWIDDFNGVITSGESRADAGPDGGLFCAAGVLRAADPSDYGAFMRYALRGSLRGRYAIASLGIRVVRDVTK